MKKIFQQTSELQHFFEQLYEKSLNPFWIAEVKDDDFIIVIANPAAQRLEPEQVPGASIRRLANKIGAADEMLKGYYQAIASGNSVQFEQRPIVAEKEYLFRTLIVPIKNSAGEITHIWGSAHNLTDFLDPQKELLAINKLLDEKVRERTQQLDEVVQELERISCTDDLTSLPNRRHFDKQLKQAIVECNANELPLSLIYMDIDFFKQFNDKYGHAAGDACLKSVADTLNDFNDGERTLVARYGGEEFVVLLANTDEVRAKSTAKTILRSVESLSVSIGNRVENVTISAGVASSLSSSHDSDALLKAADDALYRAKEKGRNCVEVEIIQ
ncbi:MAG: diguanylate cyclase domain-containing protein [Pseudomonadota bacterium]